MRYANFDTEFECSGLNTKHTEKADTKQFILVPPTTQE